MYISLKELNKLNNVKTELMQIKKQKILVIYASGILFQPVRLMLPIWYFSNGSSPWSYSVKQGQSIISKLFLYATLTRTSFALLLPLEAKLNAE